MIDPTSLKGFEVDEFFAGRLAEQGSLPTLLLGITVPDERRERIRQEILRLKRDMTVVGKGPNGKAETYAQLFQRVYGEPL